MSEKVELAVIIPVFNEEKLVEKHIQSIYECISTFGMSFQIVLVDDGSKDQTWNRLKSIEKNNPCVSIHRLSRNFGKEIAICAGLDTIDAHKYVVMDSDLQHPPRYIKAMIDLMNEKNVDIVEGVKNHRGTETLRYKLLAKSFYHMLKSTTGLELDNSSDFKVMKFSVVESIRQFKEKNIFFRGIVDWVGFQKEVFPFDVDEREDGSSRFSTFRLIKLALTAVLSHTSKPLFLTIIFGGIFFALAVLLGLQTLYNYFTGSAVSGFTTVILLQLIIGAMIMLSLGIIGIYISRIYDEVKGRPQYVISESVKK